ncbi:hypothetical protein ACJIZ3_008312 [Penstemon smallii]|uniref:VTT domain-containing protein n=1 Tax=Penstemon smallii TaxID=265156 RepID=A0ABD3TAB5_9LAMI
MTYNVANEDLSQEGHYVKLDDAGADCGPRCQDETPSYTGWWWAKLVLAVLLAVGLGAIFFKWVGPFIMEKEIIPIINWEMEIFSRTKLALVIFGTLTIFPSILLPSSPSMWVAGMTFGYGYGFLLIIGGAAIGVTLPYLIGSLFYHKINVWLERYPKKASIVKLAGEGDWFNQFRAVVLIRISPFPYIIYNYCAVATDVKYVPYLLGSLVGLVPDIVVSLYTGILIKTLADASHDRRSLTVLQIIINAIGFCLTVSTTVIITLYAKKRLKQLQVEEDQLLY